MLDQTQILYYESIHLSKKYIFQENKQRMSNTNLSKNKREMIERFKFVFPQVAGHLPSWRSDRTRNL